MESSDQLTLTLDELRRSYDEYEKTYESLEGKASTLMSAASALIALFGILKTPIFVKGQPVSIWLGVLALTIAYLMLTGLCSAALWPRTYWHPIPADWERLSQELLAKSPAEAYLKVISSYIKYIPLNRDLNDQKASLLQTAILLLFLIVVLILALGLFAH